MPNLTNPQIMLLAQTYLPYLLFDPMERIFPAVAEEWIDHQSPEKWSASPTHQRGTAALITPILRRSIHLRMLLLVTTRPLVVL